MEVPDDFLDKVRFLCKHIAKHEWSGVLFYKMEGSIMEPTNCKIILHDILLMDKGTSVYTSFNWDEDVVMYQMENPELMDMHIGHIHSHNTMNVFFSGTDDSELNDNCPAHNLYLSVIVNNYLDIEAKIAFTAKPTVFTCKNEKGKDYTMTLQNSPLDAFMFVYDCQVVMTPQVIAVSEGFSTRLKVIEDQAARAAKKAAEEAANKAKLAAAQKAANPNQAASFWGDGGLDKSKFPGYNPGQKAHQTQESMIERDYNAMEMGMYGMDMGDDDEGGITDLEVEDDIEGFAIFLVRLGDGVELGDLEDNLMAIEKSDVDTTTLWGSMVEQYGALFEQYFDDKAGYEGDQKFLEVLEQVIVLYEEQEEDYPFLTPVVSGLKTLGNRFEVTINPDNE